MPSFLSKIKALASPSSKRKSKSATDLNNYSSQGYVFKEKDLSKLQLAAWKGDMEKVAEYCKPGKLDAPDKEGRTSLHLAVAANHRNVVQYLLDQGAKLDAFDKESRSPLIIATINGSVEILSMLLASNKNKARLLVNKNDNKGLNVLHYAVRNEKASLILRIISNIDSLEINHEDKDKNTALHIATITENLEVVRLLIERGAEIDAQNCDGRTPLMLAAIKGLDNIMRLLVDYSCDQNIRDRENNRAEDYAKGKPDCMDVLKGVVRQSKSFSVPDKKVQNPQTMRSPSLGHEATLSDTTDKFQKLFGSSGASNMLEPDDDDDDEDDDDGGEEEDDDDEGLDTSQILDQNDNQHLYVNRGVDKVNSWNDSDLSFQDNPILLSNAERNQQFGASNFDSIFQTFKADNQPQTNQKQTQNQNKPAAKSILTKKQPVKEQFSDDNSWNDSTFDDKNIIKKNQENFAFVSIGDLKNENIDQSKNECTWFIYIYTSNIKNAGTDAKVSIQIIGTKGMSNKIQLDKEENISNKDLFETGSCDKFVKVFSDFGKPAKIKIGHDNSGSFAGWHLDKVILQRASTQDKFTFTAKRWLAKDEGDKKTEIDINVDEPAKDDRKSLNSWNSSGDEDSSISLKKPANQKATPLNQINEELNETSGSKKSGNSNAENNENKKVNSNFNNEFVDSMSEMSMNNLSNIEKLVNTLVKPDKKNTSSDSKLSSNNSKENNYTNSFNNESTELVDLLLNEMYSPSASNENNDKPLVAKKLSSISLISLNNTLDQQAQNKTNASSITQISPFSNNTPDRQKRTPVIMNSKNDNTNDSSILFNNSNLMAFTDSDERITANVFIRPFSSMSDDNDPYQGSAKSFVQLAGTLKSEPKNSDLLQVVDYDDDNDILYKSQNKYAAPNRIVSFASINKKNREKNNDKSNNIVSDTIVNTNNKMPRETSWANKQQQQQQQQKHNYEPPEISDIDDDSSDIEDFIEKRGFRGNNERGVDVPEDFKQPIGNSIVNAVMGSIPKKTSIDQLVHKKEDLVDLEDFSDWGDSSSANPGKNSSKYVIPNALVKPVVETKPHHGLVSRGDGYNIDTPIYENEEELNNNTGKFTVHSPKKDTGKQSTPLKYPNTKRSSIDDKSDDTEYENDSDRDSPFKKSNTNPISNVFINKNTKQNDSFYEDIGSDIDDIENEIQNIINKKPPTQASNPSNQPNFGDLMVKAIMNPQQQTGETKWTNFNEIDKKQNSPKINNKIETSFKTEENYVPNSTIGKLISNFAPKNANILHKKDDQDQVSDLESTSEMRTSKIEELITSLQPNKTTWGQKNKLDENKGPKTSENNSPVKQQDNDNSALASLISQTVLLSKGNSSKSSTTESSPVKPQQTSQQDNKPDNNNSALASLISQTIILPKGNISKPSTTDSSPIKQQTSQQDNKNNVLGALVNQHMSLPKGNADLSTLENNSPVKQQDSNNSALATLISQTVLLPKGNTPNSSKPSTTESSPVKQPQQPQQQTNQQDNNNNSALASLISQTIILPKGNAENTSKPSTAQSSPVKQQQPQQPANQQENKYSALGPLVNQHMSLLKENTDLSTAPSTLENNSPVKQQDSNNSALATLISQTVLLPKGNTPNASKPSTTESSPVKQNQTQDTKYSGLSALVNQNMSLPKEKVDSYKPPMSDSSPNKQQQFSVLNSLVGNTIKLQNNNNSNTEQKKPNESTQQFTSFDFINQGLKSNSTGNLKEEPSTLGVDQLISQILTKKVDDDEDERKAEYLRKKRAEQEKELALAKRKQKDHGGSLSSDFDEDEDENDVDEYDVDDNGIVVEPPIAFSKHSGNISSSLGTFSPSGGNGMDFDRNSHINNKKGNLIDIIDFSTSESDFLRNDHLSRETDKFKNQFDLISTSSNLVQQQLKGKQTEVAQLKQQLDEALKQKKILESELKASNDKKKDLEAVLASTEHVLAEKEKIHLDIGSKTNETEVIIRKNNLMIKDLQNELNNLKNEKSNLESRLQILQSTNKTGESSFIQSLNEQNEKYSIEIKALKNQIEELNTDRNKLSETKEELSFLLDKSDNRISEQNTVLEKIINQSEFEKAVMKTENAKLKNDLNELNELKKKLTDEIQRIKIELKETKVEIEKLTREKQELEKNVDREMRDKENIKKKFDVDTNVYKEQQLQLIEKLGFTEAKLVSAEKEYKYCKNTLQEKQAQLDELKGTLTKMNSELNVQEGSLNKEREEKIRLSAKNESIEERLRLIQEENNNLKRQHSDFVETSKFEKIHTVSLKEMEKKKIDSEKEVSLLKQDLNLLNQKLHNAELELKNEKHVHVNQASKPYETHEYEKIKQSSPLKNENKDAYMEESRKIKMELDQLRGEFHLLLSKYEVPENDQQYPTRDYEIRPQDFVYNRLKSNTNRIDVPGLITSNSSSRNIQGPKNYHPIDLNNNNVDYYNNHHPQFDPSRTTIIIPNGEIIVPKSDVSPTKLSAYSNKGPCDRCYSETQNYIEMVRNEIARTVELQAAKEQPLSNLTYKSAINSHTNSKNYISNTTKLDNYESLRNSILENARYSTTNFDLVNSLRSKYFV